MKRHTRTKVVASITLGIALTAFGQQQPAGNAPRPNGPPNPSQEQAASPEAKIDPAAAERGGQLYRPNCGFCHGADARGALAPDLARSLVVLNDDKGVGLRAFLKVGRPDAGMPAFADLTAAQAADLSAFLHERFEQSRARVPMNNNAIVVGNAVAGAAYFNGEGKCSSCHKPDGAFKGIGGKYDPVGLQGRIVNPKIGRGGPPPKPSSVRVTLPSGQTTVGTLLSVNDFFVTLTDAAGVRRTFARDNEVPKVEIDDPYQAHLDNFLKLNDKNLHDLTAYLVTLK